MEQHWHVFFVLLAVLAVSWCMAAATVLCMSAGKDNRYRRTYFCSEGLLRTFCGAGHCGLLLVLLLLDYFVQPVELSTLQNCITLSAAWETASFVAALLFLWRFAGRSFWALECCHHVSAAAVSIWAMVFKLPIEIHLMMHWASAQHSFVGAYRFLSWALELEAAARSKWRLRTVTAALIHDISTMCFGLVAVASWIQHSELHLLDGVFVSACFLLASLVLLKHTDQMFGPMKGTMPAATKLLGRQPTGEADRVPACTATMEGKAANKKSGWVRTLHGLRGLCSLHVVVGHAVYFTVWEGECRRECIAEWYMGQERWDLQGGSALPLIYMISGFLVTLGCGQKLWRLPGDESRRDCGPRCHRLTDGFIWRVLGIQKPDSPKAAEEAETGSGQEKLDFFDSRSFLRKRVLRLAPMYFLTNAMSMAVMLVSGSFEAIARQRGVPYMVLWLGLSVCGLTSWMPSQSTLPPNSVTWSVSTVLFSHLLFPVLIPYLQQLPWGCGTSRALRLCIFRMLAFAVILLTAAFLNVSAKDAYLFARVWPPNTLPLFVMGSCCAYAALHDKEEALGRSKLETTSISMEREAQQCPRRGATLRHCSPRRVDALCSCMALINLSCMMLRRYGGRPHLASLLRPVGEMLHPVLYYELIRALCADYHQTSLAVRLFRSCALQFLGDVSMSLYMIHWPVQTIISRLSFPYHPEDPASELAMPLLPWWGLWAAIPVSLLLGWFFAKYVEDCAKGLCEHKASRPQGCARLGAECHGQDCAGKVAEVVPSKLADAAKVFESAPLDDASPHGESTRV